MPFSKIATPDDAGSWVLITTNLYGTASSDAAAVTVNQVPLITTDLSPVTNTVYAGIPVGLSVVAGGATPLSFRWYKNGTAIAGATNATLMVSNLTAGLFGYSVTVSNQYSPPLAKSSTNYLNVVATPDAYAAVVGADDPNSYWPLGETAGIKALDYAGFGHDGAISNGVTLGAAGPQPPTYPGFSAGTKAYSTVRAPSLIAAPPLPRTVRRISRLKRGLTRLPAPIRSLRNNVTVPARAMLANISFPSTPMAHSTSSSIMAAIRPA